MTSYDKSNPKDQKALKEAMIKAADQIKSLKTFEVKGEPIEVAVPKSQSLVTIQVKVTGASRNYGQGTLNYLKGECEGNGNAASQAMKAAWKKFAGNTSTEQLIPWISATQYKAILENCGIDPVKIPATPATAKMVDLEDLLKSDPKRQGVEGLFKHNAETLVRSVVSVAKIASVMAHTNGYNLLKTDPVSKFSTTRTETIDILDKDGKKTGERQETTTYVSIQDKKAAVDYMQKAIFQDEAIFDLIDRAEAAIKREGGREKIEEVLKEYKETLPLWIGEVQASKEAEAKAAKAAAREDKKADKDKELKSSIVKTYEMGATLQMITMLTKVSQAKAEEILRDAGYDPAKLYSEQDKAKVNVIPGGDEVSVTHIFNDVEAEKTKSATAMDKMSASDKDTKLRRTIFNMHSVFTSEEIAKYLGLSEIFVARVLDESD